VLILFLLVALPHRAIAQNVEPPATAPPPAHVSAVEGDATIARERERVFADLGMPLVPGDQLATARGRVELLLEDGTIVDVDEFSSVEIDAPTALRLTAGRLRVSVPGSGARYEIATPSASVQIDEPGEYHVNVLGSTTYSQTELVVDRGYAVLAGDRGSVNLRDGERSLTWPNDVPSRPARSTASHLDAFDQWALAQRDTGGGRGPSAQYLPPDLRAYGGALDRYGAWAYEAPYGYVWYPTVAPGWRPYYTGYWASVPAYGWTWIGAERWAWPTHHYGRWGHVRNRWFWIPGASWASAWVAWGAAPGYVGWCPLGFDNRPVFQLSVSAGYGRGWGGWTVLTRDRFGVRGAYVNRYALAPRNLPARTAFVLQSGPPVGIPRVGSRRGDYAQGRAGYARERGGPAGAARPPAARRVVPRNPGAIDRRPSARPPAAADRSGGSIAVPRGSAPGIRQAPPSSRPGPFVPFGDFRRRDGSGPGASGYAVPRTSPGGPNDSARPQRSAPPDRGDRTGASGVQRPRVNVPPPAAAGVERSRGGSRGDSGGARGGVARPRSTESPRGGSISSGDRGGAGGRQGQAAPRSDGRTHDPGSRRPR
jgi:hypothetical protein